MDVEVEEGKSEYTLCGAKCESIVHMLWEFSAVVVLESFLWRSFKRDGYSRLNRQVSVVDLAIVPWVQWNPPFCHTE